MFIYSKLSEKGLLDLSGINVIGDLFGLIGIYKTNHLDDVKGYENIKYNTLISNYDKYVNDGKKHGMRNIGEIDIKSLLENEGYCLSRRFFRLFSQTWRRVPIISYLNSDIIFNKTIERVHNDPLLWKVACEKIFISNTDNCIKDILQFQYDNVCFYLIGAESIKRKKFRKMFENWKNNNIISYLKRK